MKRAFAALWPFLVTGAAFGQALAYVPTPAGAYVNSSGSWVPLTGSGSNPVPYVPTPAGLYCSTDGTGNVGTWVPCTGTGGGGGGASITLENVYAAPGAFTFNHALNSVFYQIHCITRTGGSTYAPASWTDFPVDANNASVSVPSAGDYICSFTAAGAIPMDFTVASVPTTLTYWPTMSGTQQPTFTINQSALGGYTGTATYTTSGLASGMTGAYSPTTITGTGSSTLTLSFPSNQAAATTSFTVQGSDGTHTHTTGPSITVGNINSGLVECWAMNDGSGSAFADSCGTSNTETLVTGTLTWASNAGLPGTTATFSSTAYAVGANQTATNFDGTTPFSVSVWAKIPNTTSTHTFISSLDPATSFRGWELSANTGTGAVEILLVNTVGTNAVQLQGPTLTAGTLYNLILTYDGTKTAAGTKLYINGTVQSTSTLANNMTGTMANTKAVALGARVDGSNSINGLLGYVRIWNRVLSSTDVSNYFAAGAR